MNQDCGVVSESPFVFWTWPDNSPVALVLDGVGITDLGKQIYLWADGAEVEAECLYASTQWEAIAEVSPWIVWLKGPDDPVLAAFLELGAPKEHGYLMIAGADKPDVMHWIRAHLQVEKAPDYEELVRISHPALASSVIGEQLGKCPPSGVIRQLLIPDQISQRWHRIEPSEWVIGDADHNRSSLIYSDELAQAFDAFNMRQVSLEIWQSLDASVRIAIGGVSLKDAYPRLSLLLGKAREAGHESPRDMMRFLFSALSDEGVPVKQGDETALYDQG
ncbi:DUF4123 domain-containing protein [Marinobacter sp. G11]|uniref:DUF4123 domain-containing protein n=1 Tax=Marinobacter vinifirmus TaxID=355591 RepID=A0A558BGT3_9GAMM|nr:MULTISPECIES: DUF4123 domain-containing protein [Marinobacter]MCE0757581.1 DUF4123 domain-containing protein [Marinobacter sp. G11]TVT35724.1 MAG: DUF4123 domain-containing protein [Marinobacter vinifirmus]